MTIFRAIIGKRWLNDIISRMTKAPLFNLAVKNCTRLWIYEFLDRGWPLILTLVYSIIAHLAHGNINSFSDQLDQRKSKKKKKEICVSERVCNRPFNYSWTRRFSIKWVKKEDARKTLIEKWWRAGGRINCCSPIFNTYMYLFISCDIEDLIYLIMELHGWEYIPFEMFINSRICIKAMKISFRHL